jgi:hypothetical protein
MLGCHTDPTDVVCAPLPPWAVAVDVRDSATNAPCADILYPYADSALVGGYRVGLVVVRVERPGYTNWSVAGVRTRLTGGDCRQWETQTLTARLQPE